MLSPAPNGSGTKKDSGLGLPFWRYKFSASHNSLSPNSLEWTQILFKVSGRTSGQLRVGFVPQTSWIEWMRMAELGVCSSSRKTFSELDRAESLKGI